MWLQRILIGMRKNSEVSFPVRKNDEVRFSLSQFVVGGMASRG